jgi:biotin carboxyl carrier protein
MTFEVDVAGKTRTISVERVRDAAHYRVMVDGRTHLVDASRVGEYGLSLILDNAAAAADEPPGISREIAVVPAGARGDFLAVLDGRTIAVSVNSRQTGRAAVDAGGQAHGEQAVKAPMPGRVVRVLVAAGDDVAARQGVVVVEAMKMENELRSPKAGRVKAVAVAVGASVEAGRVLVVIE